MQWIGDRFFTRGDTWIDAASGGRVRLRLVPPAPDDLEWSEQCARLATLRHPLLNPLVDYGVGPNGSRFEAYEPRGALSVPAAAGLGERALGHVTRFLRASGVAIPAAVGAFAMRPVTAGRGHWRRPVGITLQGRRALAAVEEALDGMWPAGPSIVHVSGAAHAGLRTLRALAARSARLRGFVPVGAGVGDRFPGVMERLRDRHVCVLDDEDAPGRSAAAVSRLIAALGTGSARRHLIIRFRREASSSRRGIGLDPLSVRSLVGMVFAGGDDGPGEAELFDAARDADGLPGLFISCLSGTFPSPSSSMVVHETAPVFGGAPGAACEPVRVPGRLLRAALGATRRARVLAGQGRHGAAARVLTRALRVLEGRQRPLDAASCAVQLGWLSLDRGAITPAVSHFEQARRLSEGTPGEIPATIGLGVAFTDQHRLVEAEAILRGALGAAETVQDAGGAVAAAAALTRCVMWQERLEEAAAIAASHREVATTRGARARLLSALARTYARLGRTAPAVTAAREAQADAASADTRVQASAELALAEALDAAGDIEGARAATARASRLARTHHLPLFRVRAVMLSARFGEPAGPARSIAHLKRSRLPALLAHRLEQLGRAGAPRRLEPVAEVERLLDVAQRASDDGAAAGQICEVVAGRLRANTVVLFGNGEQTLAMYGRGWSAMPLVARETLSTGAPSRPDDAREPRESAEPVRYGGEVVGAIACRWTPGTAIDVQGAAVLLRAAALSAAPHVRALLDRLLPEPAVAPTHILGDSPAAVALRDAVARAARAPFPILVEGESGCGKELVARAAHLLGPRRDRRFCALNCAALTDDLVEAELFGHARGAFTGAAAERAGLFEEADGGTLFLDEVAELSARAQAKLLRVLQEGEIRRVGENFPRRVDVRVVAATNRRLEEEAAAGRFRSDLRFRLDVVRITVPPLRERQSDIPLLAAHFWQDAAARVGSRATLTRDALALLARYDWPGNVRELQNVIAWIAVHSPRRGRVTPRDLPRHLAQSAAAAPCSFETAREDFERRFVRAALAGANGQRARAAATLGVTRQGLSKMMKRLRIE